MDFRVKICGITNLDDALWAVDAGADAIGLNFYPRSKRFVTPEVASQIVTDVGDQAAAVGVFVNETAESICQICNSTAIGIIQLHGDQWPDSTKLMLGFGFDRVTIIRAIGFGPRGMSAVYKGMLDPGGLAADAVLVDASVSGLYGGTGQTIEWNRVANYEDSIGNVPLILAGGLTPDNVADAIRIVRPHAVDVASGVESSPGKKDASKMREFVAAARAAFSC
jgi:phosphoribosylanthranilate isomerase